MKKSKKLQGIPLEALLDNNGFNRNYKILMRERPEYTQPGLRNAIEDMVLSKAEQGRKDSVRQSETAKNNRPIKNIEDETLDQVIIKLAKNHPAEKPSALWTHLQCAIDDWSDSNCVEVKPDGKKRDSWLYQFSLNGELKTLTFGTFRKKLKIG
jgi:hypothetical protein